jgi:uncharacterized protein
MSVEWDSRKAAANLRKHAIDFADAVTALDDECAVTVPEVLSGEEPRYVTLGMDALGRVLVVVHAWRDDRIRLISARRATARERRQYGDRT